MKLYEHQMYALGKSMDEKSFAIFNETGTGKTIIAIETIKYLWQMEEINFVIILAPKLVCQSVWEIELEKYRKEGLFYKLFKWVGGISNIDKYVINEVIRAIAEERKYANILPIFLINIESFSYSKIYNLVTNIVRKAKLLMIIDESTTIKNPKAERTKGLLKLSDHIKYKRILSGYPVLKSPEDLYTQIRFLGRKLIPYESFYAFRNDYCNTFQTDKRFTIVKSHKNLDKLSKLIEPFSVRITKKECLDLPDKIRSKRYIEMTPQQLEIYSSIKNRAYAELMDCDETVFTMSFLAQLSKLHQIANGILIQHNQDIPNYKYDALIEVLTTEFTDQCTIWFWFTQTLEYARQKIAKKFGKDSVRCIYGDIPIQERVESLKAFQEGKIRFMLANPASAMHGLNMTNCSDVIYFNNSTHLEHRIQSEDRFHRIGQVNKVTYIDLVTFGTVEDKILTKLQENHKIGAEILKDEWEEWFK